MCVFVSSSWEYPLIYTEQKGKREWHFAIAWFPGSLVCLETKPKFCFLVTRAGAWFKSRRKIRFQLKYLIDPISLDILL